MNLGHLAPQAIDLTKHVTRVTLVTRVAQVTRVIHVTHVTHVTQVSQVSYMAHRDPKMNLNGSQIVALNSRIESHS